MALTINPAVSRTRIELLQSLTLFVGGVFSGASVSVLAALGLTGFAALVGGRLAILLFVSGAVLLGALRDLGLPIPLPYRSRQVPEVFRDVMPLPVVALLFGLELGVGFLTFYTTSMQLTLVVTAPGSTLVVTALGPLAFGLGKLVIVLSMLRVRSLDEVPHAMPTGWRHVRVMRLGTAVASVSVLVHVVAGALR